MSQTISITFGEYITDTSIHRAVPLPPGVYEGLTPSISAGVVTFQPGIWRTLGTSWNTGRHTIYEDTAFAVNIDAASTQDRIDAIVGAHKWVMGPIDSNGEPTGEITPEMQAIYQVVKGTPGASPQIPPIPDPYDGNGRRAVILALVFVPASGSPTAWIPGPCDHRRASFVRYSDDRIDLAPRLGIVTVPPPPAGDNSSRACTTAFAQGLSTDQRTYIDQQISGRAPSAHTHAIQDVTGLTESLNGKAATAHHHSNAEIDSLAWSKLTAGGSVPNTGVPISDTTNENTYALRLVNGVLTQVKL